MGGVWVFPGGAVDADEGDGDDAHRAAAVRELREEAAIELDDPDALVKFSRWITPGAGEDPLRHALLPRAAARRPGAAGRRRGVRRPRLVHAAGGARRARRASEIVLVFPTIKHLEQLGGFATVDELLALRARARRAAGRAAGRARGRGRARAAARRARLLSARQRSPRRLAQRCLLGGDHVRDGVDQRQVGERLRVVAEVAAATRPRAPRRRARAARSRTAGARTGARPRGARRSPTAPRPARRSRSGTCPPRRCRPSSVSSVR